MVLITLPARYRTACHYLELETGVSQENLLHTLRKLPVSVWYVFGTLVMAILRIYFYYVTL